MSSLGHRDAGHAIRMATMMLPRLIERGEALVLGLRGESSWEPETITGSVRDWLQAPRDSDAVAIDLRTPGECVLAHADVLCRMRYARDLVDFTVRDLVCDGPAMGEPRVVETLARFAEEHRA